MKKNIVLINDLPGYGKVALAAVLPVVSAMGYSVSTLPTALVTNVLDYGTFQVQDLTGYMKESVRIWDELGFHFDCICTGYINSEAQFDLAADFIRNRRGAYVIVDPVLGDDGHLYPGFDESKVEGMKRLTACADLITPNLTEAACLLGETLEGDAVCDRIQEDRIREMIDRLRRLGAKSVLITSVKLTEEEAHSYIYGFDHVAEAYFRIAYDQIDVRFPGTGDVFTGVTTGELLRGRPLEEAARTASEFLAAVIRDSMAQNYDPMEGLFLENQLFRLTEPELAEESA